MQDRPDAHELLEALERYLRDDLLPDAPPEHRFRVRVAANLCAILARETAPLAPNRAAERELVAEIRAGAWDARLPELAAELRPQVRAKLEVDNPNW
jgi:hypothetical protein